MGLHLTKDSVKSGRVIWQKVLETARGGFTLDPSGLSDGDVIPAGTPVSFDESTRIAKIMKTARVYETAAGSPTAIKVEKGHVFKVGDFIAKTAGGDAYAITSIDTSNVDYDVINVGTTIGSVTAGDALFQSLASGASAAAVIVSAEGLLYDDVEVSKDVSLSVVIRGTVYARRAPVPAAVQTTLPLIVFSNSY